MLRSSFLIGLSLLHGTGSFSSLFSLNFSFHKDFFPSLAGPNALVFGSSSHPMKHPFMPSELTSQLGTLFWQGGGGGQVMELAVPKLYFRPLDAFTPHYHETKAPRNTPMIT